MKKKSTLEIDKSNFVLSLLEIKKRNNKTFDIINFKSDRRERKKQNTLKDRKKKNGVRVSSGRDILLTNYLCFTSRSGMGRCSEENG